MTNEEKISKIAALFKLTNFASNVQAYKLKNGLRYRIVYEMILPEDHSTYYTDIRDSYDPINFEAYSHFTIPNYALEVYYERIKINNDNSSDIQVILNIEWFNNDRSL